MIALTILMNDFIVKVQKSIKRRIGEKHDFFRLLLIVSRLLLIVSRLLLIVSRLLLTVSRLLLIVSRFFLKVSCEKKGLKTQ